MSSLIKSSGYMYLNQYGDKRQIAAALTDNELLVLNDLLELLQEVVDPKSCKDRTLGRRALKAIRKRLGSDLDNFLKESRDYQLGYDHTGYSFGSHFRQLRDKMEWHFRYLGGKLNSFGL